MTVIQGGKFFNVLLLNIYPKFDFHVQLIFKHSMFIFLKIGPILYYYLFKLLLNLILIIHNKKVYLLFIYLIINIYLVFFIDLEEHSFAKIKY